MFNAHLQSYISINNIQIMELKKDFIETISRLYVEKHKPQVYKKILESLVIIQ